MLITILKTAMRIVALYSATLAFSQRSRLTVPCCQQEALFFVCDGEIVFTITAVESYVYVLAFCKYGNRYCAVMLLGYCLTNSAGGPSATTLPPLSPPSGPISIT